MTFGLGREGGERRSHTDIWEEECSRLRKYLVWGSRVEDNEETKSGVATVWDQGREGHVMKTERLAMSAMAEPCELW